MGDQSAILNVAFDPAPNGSAAIDFNRHRSLKADVSQSPELWRLLRSPWLDVAEGGKVLACLLLAS